MDDDLLGGPPVKKAAGLFDEDFLGGPTSPKGGQPNDLLFGGGGAGGLDDMDFLGGPPKAPSPKAGAQPTQRDLTPEEMAEASVKLKEENAKISQEIVKVRDELKVWNNSIDALRQAKGKGQAGQIGASIATMEADIDSTDKAIEDLKGIREKLRSQLTPLETTVAQLKAAREATIVATRDEREQADLMKSAQEFELQRNVNKREIEAATAKANDLESLTKLPATVTEIGKFIQDMEGRISKATDDFYVERERKNKVQAETTEFETQAQALQEELAEITKKLKAAASSAPPPEPVKATAVAPPTKVVTPAPPPPAAPPIVDI
jgi:uncharacterized protein YukE